MRLKDKSRNPGKTKFTRPWLVVHENDIPRDDDGNREKTVLVEGPGGQKEELPYIVYPKYGGFIEVSAKGKIQVTKEVGEAILKDPGCVGIVKDD